MGDHQPRVRALASTFLRMATIFLLLLCSSHAQDGNFPSMHAIITTQCGLYFSWQSLGFFYSWRKV